MTGTRARTWAAICALTFHSDRDARDHLTEGAEPMTTDPFTTAASDRALSIAMETFKPGFDPENHPSVYRLLVDMAEWARTHLAAQEPTNAEVEAAHAAYWPAYSEAVRNASSNRPGQGISAEDARKAGLAGHRAALLAARAVGRDTR